MNGLIKLTLAEYCEHRACPQTPDEARRDVSECGAWEYSEERTGCGYTVVSFHDEYSARGYVFEGSALVVTPDTGPLHIARAVGTPVVSLFGRTNPKRSGPYRAYQDLVVDGYAAHEGEDYSPAPLYRDGMRRITPDMVMQKVALAMRTYVPGRDVEPR